MNEYTIQELEYLIIKYSDLYYNNSISMISDKEFDNLVNKLKKLDPNNNILNNIGSDPKSNLLKKSKHLCNISNFKSFKRYKEDDLKKVISTIKFNDSYVSFKLDGISCIAYYSNGKLNKILTRGNGIEGLDITYNLRYSSISKEVDKDIKWIRYEILSKENRNICSGIIQSLNPSKDKLDSLTCIELYNNKELKPSKELRYIHIKDNLEEAIKYVKLLEESYEYPTDGCVVYFDNHKPIIVKYKDKTYKTIVRDIKWNITKTFKYVPIIYFDEVIIDNTHISKVNGFNLNKIKSFNPKLSIGSEIEISRTNSVIPNLINVISTKYPININEPNFCKICNSKLFKNNEIICKKCRNT